MFHLSFIPVAVAIFICIDACFAFGMLIHRSEAATSSLLSTAPAKGTLERFGIAEGDIPTVAKPYRRKEAGAVPLQEARPCGLEQIQLIIDN
jgi:hypothetical protein